MTSEIDIPWLDPDEIRNRAERFLAEKHRSGEPPVPVELIVEWLGIDIVPVPNLRDLMDVEGLTSADMGTIYVDKYVSEHRENRYRFTLAHELGHIILHPSLFARLKDNVTTIEAWIRRLREVPAETYGRAEWQANTFGGLILVPSEQLRTHYEKLVPGIRLLLRKAHENGASQAGAREFAWQALADHLAPPFEASSEVILRRLKFDGYSRANL